METREQPPAPIEQSPHVRARDVAIVLIAAAAVIGVVAWLAMTFVFSCGCTQPA